MGDLRKGYADPVFNVDGTVRIHAGHSTNVLSDLAMGMLQTFESSDATPWFLYLAPQAPHSPFTPDEPYLHAAVPPWRPGPAFNEAAHQRQATMGPLADVFAGGGAHLRAERSGP